MSLINKMIITYHQLIIDGSAGGFTSDSGAGSFSWSSGEVDVSGFNFFSNMMGHVDMDLSTKFENSKYYMCKTLVDKYEKAPHSIQLYKIKMKKRLPKNFLHA